jgi:hypothetical protein
MFTQTAYAPIPTTTTAKRPVETQIEYDAPVLAIRKGKAEDLYTVRELPVGAGFDGRGFALLKDRTGEHHHTFVARDGSDSCDCPGGTYTGRCKHLDALRHLMTAGRL